MKPFEDNPFDGATLSYIFIMFENMGSYAKTLYAPQMRLKEYAAEKIAALSISEKALLDDVTDNLISQSGSSNGFSEKNFLNMRILGILNVPTEAQGEHYTPAFKEALALQWVQESSPREWLYKHGSAELVNCLLDVAERKKWWDSCLVDVPDNPEYSQEHFLKIMASRHLLDHLHSLDKVLNHSPAAFFTLEVLQKLMPFIRSRTFKLTDPIKAAVYQNEFPDFRNMPEGWASHMFDLYWDDNLKKKP